MWEVSLITSYFISIQLKELVVQKNGPVDPNLASAFHSHGYVTTMRTVMTNQTKMFVVSIVYILGFVTYDMSYFYHICCIGVCVTFDKIV